ncbi:MAG: dTMP kinase [Dethiobacteria bacterium]|jgi:dTMP kinase|nr:dTMP kinase [Bacillota bacterium]
MKGVLITLEGIDGVGKSTQHRLLEQRLRETGLTCIVTREPGGTAIGEEVRQLLLKMREEEMALETEILLYAAARAQLYKELLRPALEAGKIVLCDRFIDSSLAYQGYGCGGDLNYIKKVNAGATEKLSPDLTLLFDLAPQEARQRRGNIDQKSEVSDRIENRPEDFHYRVREGYLKLAAANPVRIKLLDASLPAVLLLEKSWVFVKELLEKKELL